MQGVDIINSSNSIVGWFYKKQHDIAYYFHLKQTNDQLLAENARLRDRIATVTNIDTFAEGTVRYPVRPVDSSDNKPVNDTAKTTTGKSVVIHYASYSYIPARVINNSIANDRMNYITLNRGSNAGVKKEMAVVCGNGIVGRVANVSANYSTVISVLSEGRKYSARLPNGQGGFIHWQKGSPDYVIMEKIPMETKVKQGDSVFTMNSFFPPDLYIGTVSKIATAKIDNTKTLTIRLSTNFRNLQYVYIVKDADSEEKQKLEATNAQPK